MICGCISLKAEGIVCCHGYLIHVFTSDHGRSLSHIAFFFFSVMVHQNALRFRTNGYMKLGEI